MYKIYLSPSNQVKNRGYGNYGTEEMRMNQLADKIAKLLKKKGYIIYRPKKHTTLQQKVVQSNSLEPDVHIALHSNAGGGKATRP